MIIQIEAFSYQTQEWFQKALDIRTQVFVEEQGVDKHLEFDGLDFKASHYLLVRDGQSVGCARSRETEEGIKLERFAVLKQFRGKLLGALILQYVMEDVLPANRLIYLHAQDIAVGFYKKFGFVEVGEHFIEADIKHIRMEYKPKKVVI